MIRIPARAAALAVMAVLAAGFGGAQAAPAHFDPAPWRDDYAWLKSQLQQSYSHLAWLGSEEGGVDLPALDLKTRGRIDAATSDAEAAQAIRDFVAGFRDGHFSELPTLAPAPAGPKPVARDLSQDGPRAGCAALGYAHRTPVPFSAPFEALAGFQLLDDGRDKGFRAGVIPLADGRLAGVVRIQRFRPQEYPELCEAVWPADPAQRTADQVLDLVQGAMLRGLAERLRDFTARGVGVVLVDVGGDGGGNDLGDWMVRLFSARPVRSAPLLMVQAPAATGYLDEQLESLKAARQAPALSPAAWPVLDEAISAFERRKAAIAGPACDLGWVWRERRHWRDLRAGKSCDRLIEAGFASGALPWLEAGSLAAPDAESALYWPTIVGDARGAWTGPVYVLTDGRTASSAEMFTASIRDNGVARVIGTRTMGLGCGFMGDEGAVTLPHSHLRFRAPNCVRLRADGSDEVAGITPDLPILPSEGESETSRADRILRTVAADMTVNRPSAQSR